MKNVTILKIRMFLNILNIKYSILFLMLYFENITFKNYYFIHIYLYMEIVYDYNFAYNFFFIHD